MASKLRCRHCGAMVPATSKGSLRGIMIDHHKRDDGTWCQGGMSAGEESEESGHPAEDAVEGLAAMERAK